MLPHIRTAPGGRGGKRNSQPEPASRRAHSAAPDAGNGEETERPSSIAAAFLAEAPVEAATRRLFRMASRLSFSGSVKDNVATAETMYKALVDSRKVATRRQVVAATFLEVGWSELASGSEALCIGVGGVVEACPPDDFAALLGVVAHREDVHVLDFTGSRLSEDKGHLLLHLLGNSPHVQMVIFDVDNGGGTEGSGLSFALQRAIEEQCAQNASDWQDHLDRRARVVRRRGVQLAKQNFHRNLEGIIEDEQHTRIVIDEEETLWRRKIKAHEHMNVSNAKKRMKRRIGNEVDRDARAAIEATETQKRSVLELQRDASMVSDLAEYQQVKRLCVIAAEKIGFEALLIARKDSRTASMRATQARLQRRIDERAAVGKLETEGRVMILQNESYIRMSLQSDEQELRDFVEKMVGQRVERVHGEQRRKRAERDRLLKEMATLREREKSDEVKRAAELARDKDRVMSRSHVVINATEREQATTFEMLRLLYFHFTNLARLEDAQRTAEKRIAAFSRSLRPQLHLCGSETSFFVQRYHRPVDLRLKATLAVPEADLATLAQLVDAVRSAHTAFIREVARVRQALVIDGSDDLMLLMETQGFMQQLMEDHSEDRCPQAERLVAELSTPTDVWVRIAVTDDKVKQGEPNGSRRVPPIVSECLQLRDAMPETGTSSACAVPAKWSRMEGSGSGGGAGEAAAGDNDAPNFVAEVALCRSFHANEGGSNAVERATYCNTEISNVLNDVAYSAAVVKDGVTPHYIDSGAEVLPLSLVDFEPFLLRFTATVEAVVGVVGAAALDAKGRLDTTLPSLLTETVRLSCTVDVPIVVLPPSLKNTMAANSSPTTADTEHASTRHFGDETVDVYREGAYVVRALQHVAVRPPVAWRTNGTLSGPQSRQLLAASSASPSSVSTTFIASDASSGFSTVTVTIRIVNPVADCDFLLLWLEPNWTAEKAVQQTASNEMPHVIRLTSGTIVQVPTDVSCGSPITSFELAKVKLVHRLTLRFLAPSRDSSSSVDTSRPSSIQVRDIEDMLRCIRFGTIRSPVTGYRRIETVVLHADGEASTNYSHLAVVGATQPTMRVARLLTQRPFYAIAGSAVHPLAGILVQVDSAGLVRLLPDARLILVGGASAPSLVEQLTGAAGAAVRTAEMTVAGDLDDRNAVQQNVEAQAAIFPHAQARIEATIVDGDFEADDLLTIDESALPPHINTNRKKTAIFLPGDVMCPTNFAGPSATLDLSGTTVSKSDLEAILRAVSFASSKRRSHGDAGLGATKRVRVHVRYGEYEAHDLLEVIMLAPHVEMPLASQRRHVCEGRRECTFGPFIAAPTSNNAIDCFNGGWARVAVVQGQGPEDVLSFRPDHSLEGFSLRRRGAKYQKRTHFAEPQYDPIIPEKGSDDEAAPAPIPPPTNGAASFPPHETLLANPLVLSAALKGTKTKPALAKRVPYRWSLLKTAQRTNATALMSWMSDRFGAPLEDMAAFADMSSEDIVTHIADLSKIEAKQVVFPGGASTASGSVFNAATGNGGGTLPLIDRARGAIREFVRIGQEHDAWIAKTPNDGVVETEYEVVSNATQTVIGFARVKPHEIFVWFAPANDDEPPITRAVALSVLQRATYYCRTTNKADIPKKFIRFSMKPYDGSSSQIVCVSDISRDAAVPRITVAFSTLTTSWASFPSVALGCTPLFMPGQSLVEDDTPSGVYDGGQMIVTLQSPFGDDQVIFMGREEQAKAQALGDVWHQEQRFLIAQKVPLHPNVCDLLVRHPNPIPAVSIDVTPGAEPGQWTLRFVDSTPQPAASPKKKKKDANESLIGIATVDANHTITINFHAHSAPTLRPEYITALLNCLAVRSRPQNTGRRVVAVRLRRGGEGPKKWGQGRVVLDLVPPLLTFTAALSPVLPVKKPAAKAGIATVLCPTFEVAFRLPSTRLTKGYLEVRLADMNPGAAVEWECISIDEFGQAPLPPPGPLGASSIAAASPAAADETPQPVRVRQHGRDIYVDGAFVGMITVNHPMHLKIAFTWASSATPPRLTTLLTALRYTWWGPQREKSVRNIEVTLSDGSLPAAPTVALVAVTVDGDGGAGVPPTTHRA